MESGRDTMMNSRLYQVCQSMFRRLDDSLNARMARSARAREIHWEKIRRILLIETGSLAEGLAMLPTIRLLRNQCPDAELHMVTSTPVASALAGHPEVERIVEVRKSASGSLALSCGNLAILRRIRRRRYDLAISLSHRPDNRLLLGVSGARLRIGPACRLADWMLTHRTGWQGMMHRVDANLCALRQLGCDTEEGEMRFSYGFLEVETIRAMLMGASRPWIGIHPAPPEAAGWPMEKFIETVQMLQPTTHGTVIVTGSSSEREKLQTALEGIPRSANFSGLLKPSLSQALIAEMDILITGAPAAVQMAAGVNTPTVAVMTRTDAENWSPLAADSVLLEESESLTGKSVMEAAQALLQRVSPTIEALTGGAGFGKAA